METLSSLNKYQTQIILEHAEDVEQYSAPVKNLEALSYFFYISKKLELSRKTPTQS